MLRALALAALTLAFASGGAETARAQYAEGGARGLAMGRVGVALGGQTWGQANPATWATAARGLGVEASQAYGLEGLRIAGASASVPLALGTLAASGRTYGADGYAETRILAGFAREVPLSSARTLALGLAVGYDGVSIDDFGSKGSLHLSVGVQGDVVPTVRAGFALRNALGFFDDTEADLTRPLGSVPSVAAGLAFRPSDRALLALDLDQNLDGDLSVRAGLEARVVQPLAVRAGVGTGPTTFSAGVGIYAGPLAADLAVEHHEDLGLTPAVSLQIGF
ncbi:hypothetical protein [Rubricoccus marinus]|uniref:DUF5723 domain-containing protein n=1 Tax=Rubricoccus marinus TaxID=716817 RepID=A0A259TWZ6_9BACT|nr:hypothetical protein [Rubricoccus marinus]OZC02273.1 hypothetical protein BSZ36_04305 [Rubricoccus marinus]